MQALALLLFIVPFTLSFFLNGCFEADMDNRLPATPTLLPTSCFPAAVALSRFLAALQILLRRRLPGQ